MGDGSWGFALNFNTRCEYRYRLTMTSYQENEPTLTAVKNKFKGVGQIRRVGNNRTACQFDLE